MRMRATAIAHGKVRIIGIDRDTGKRRVITQKNAITTAGNEFIAAAIAGGAKLNPSNSQLNCRVLRTSGDSAGGFTSSGGPMTAPVRVNASGTVVAVGGTPIFDNPPSTDNPVRLRWYDASNSAYALHSVQIRNGATVLSTVTLAGSPADKSSNEIIIVEYVLAMSVPAPFAGSAGIALTRLLGGQAGSLSANSKTADSTNPAASIDSTTAEGAAVTFSISTTNQSSDLTNKRISGFILSFGTAQIVDYTSPNAARYPAPGGGSIEWTVTLNIGTAAAGVLTVSAVPGSVTLNQGNSFSQTVRITASGGAGSTWTFRPTAVGTGLQTRFSGSGPTWDLEISSTGGSMGRGHVDVAVTRSDGTTTTRGSVRVPASWESR